MSYQAPCSKCGWIHKESSTNCIPLRDSEGKSFFTKYDQPGDNSFLAGQYAGPRGSKAAFNQAVDEVLDEAKAVSDQRGAEYQDTWHLDNVVTTYLDAANRAIINKRLGSDPISYLNYTSEEKRLLIVAALVDVKSSRMLGAYKRDSVLDAVNYMAAFATWMKAYLE